MSTKVHNTRCVDLVDCAQRGVDVRASRQIADWHLSLARSAPGVEQRGRHRLIGDYFFRLINRLSGR